MYRSNRQISTLKKLVLLLAVTLLLSSACGREAAAPSPRLIVDTTVSDTVVGDATTTTGADTDTDPTGRTIVERLTWVATAKDAVTTLQAYDRPDGELIGLPFDVPNPHQFGNTMTLMVTEGEPGDEWLRVQLPVRPNGQEGWIPASDYDLEKIDVWAEVQLSTTSVVVYKGDTILAETAAVIGSSITPTPVGTFFVSAKKRNSESYLGPWALALSGFSEVHESFAGGLPVIAIHGTNRPEQVGQSRSNGCIRIPNDVVTFLAENVPLGAPVVISA